MFNWVTAPPTFLFLVTYPPSPPPRCAAIVGKCLEPDARKYEGVLPCFIGARNCRPKIMEIFELLLHWNSGLGIVYWWNISLFLTARNMALPHCSCCPPVPASCWRRSLSFLFMQIVFISHPTDYNYCGIFFALGNDFDIISTATEYM